MRRYVASQLEAEFRRGANILPGDPLMPDERETISKIINVHFQSIDKMAADIFAAVDAGLT